MPNPITPVELKPASTNQVISPENLALALNIITRKLNEIILVVNDLRGRVDDLEDLP